jgi:O-antigen/teichoic acid export membrane protein
VRGIAWTILSYGGAKAISLLAMLVLARLLMPEDFGIVALATTVIELSKLFRDLGIGPTIILRQDLGPADLQTLFSLMMGFFVVTAGVVAAVGPLAAATFGEPRLGPVVTALSLSVLLSGVGWFYDCLQQRELEFRNRFWAQLALSVATWGFSVALALCGWGVWSLVLGQIAGAVAFSATQLVLAPYRVRPGFDRAVARAGLVSGRGFLLQGTITFIQENGAFFAVGRLLDPTRVGFFAMSYRLGELPYMAVADPMAKATSPGFARMRHRGEDVTASYLGFIRIIGLVATPFALLLSACAGPFTRGVLGDQWAGMTGTLLVLGIWGAVRPLQSALGWFLNAVGLVDLQARIVAVLLVAQVPALVIGGLVGGLEAIGWVMVADAAATVLVFAHFAGRRIGIGLRTQLSALRPVLVASGPCWLAAFFASRAVDPAFGALGALLAGVLAGLTAYVVGLVLVERDVLRSTLAQLRRAARPGAPVAVGGDR